jgi:hypothetical protein
MKLKDEKLFRGPGTGAPLRAELLAQHYAEGG